MGTLYEDLKAADCEMDHHESDLYVLATAKAIMVLHLNHPDVKFTRFLGNDGRFWLDLPFMYSPWWEHRNRK